MVQHPKVSDREDSVVDIGRIIDEHSCSKEYYVLEECLGTHDRVWAKCQSEVSSLKKCNLAKAAATATNAKTSTSIATAKEIK